MGTLGQVKRGCESEACGGVWTFEMKDDDKGVGNKNGSCGSRKEGRDKELLKDEGAE